MDNRYYSLDVLKIICAILVVCLHTNCAWHYEFLPLTRCAVPCFFMISGFLLYSNHIGLDRLRRNISRIFALIVVSTLIFAFYKELIAILDNKFYFPSLKDWFKFFIFNENPFASHLWYLSAYLYVLFIVVIVDKYQKWNILFCLIPILLFGDLLLGKYSLVLLGKQYHYILVRNFIFVGIPYFALGAWVKKEEIHKKNFNKYILLGGVILFSLTSVAEKYILLFLDKSSIREHYISSTFLALCLFLLAVCTKTTHKSFFSEIGRKDALYIYLFHPLFIHLFQSLSIYSVTICKVYEYTAPLIVLIATMLFILILRKIKIIK